MEQLTKALTGAEAAAEAMKQIDPDVVPVYPITPQTGIVEAFADFSADGLVSGRIINVESEHSAMSAAIGAAAAGTRAMTASSSAGLALMFEMLGVASGLRLPIVMNIANRALSAPLNIHCDHSDSMAVRDMGWIQIYSEGAQEVYDHNFLALKIAEAVKLPAMVMQDGYITSHLVERVETVNESSIRDFIGDYRPEFSLLDVDNPVTIGALQLPDYFFETKRQQIEAMEQAGVFYEKAAQELSAVTGRAYPKLETYRLEDAQVAIMVLNSTAGTARVVVDELRDKKGMKVGLIKPRLFLPFPQKELREAVVNVQALGVMDRAVAYGSDAPLCKEVRNALFETANRPKVQSYVFGLGGREIFAENIESAFQELMNGKISESQVKYIGLRE